MKYIRKVVHHLPSDKEWFTQGTEMTTEVEQAYLMWQHGIMCGDTVAFSLITGNGTTDYRQMGFSENIVKDCVVSLEVYEVRQ